MENKTKKMLDVDSSNIKAICFLGNKVLIVEFMNENIYAYEKISRKEYESILFADSVGKEFHKIIVKGEKPCTLIKGSK